MSTAELMTLTGVAGFLIFGGPVLVNMSVDFVARKLRW